MGQDGSSPMVGVKRPPKQIDCKYYTIDDFLKKGTCSKSRNGSCGYSKSSLEQCRFYLEQHPDLKKKIEEKRKKATSKTNNNITKNNNKEELVSSIIRINGNSYQIAGFYDCECTKLALTKFTYNNDILGCIPPTKGKLLISNKNLAKFKQGEIVYWNKHYLKMWPVKKNIASTSVSRLVPKPTKNRGTVIFADIETQLEVKAFFQYDSQKNKYLIIRDNRKYYLSDDYVEKIKNQKSFKYEKAGLWICFTK